MSQDPRRATQLIIEACSLALRGEATRIKAAYTKERLSAPWVREIKDGRIRLIKNPAAAGVRRRSGKLVESFNVKATSTGLQSGRFRGVLRLRAEIGRGVPYAHVHERTGRLAFEATMQREFSAVVEALKAQVRRIATSAGARVT